MKVDKREDTQSQSQPLWIAGVQRDNLYTHIINHFDRVMTGRGFRIQLPSPSYTTSLRRTHIPRRHIFYTILENTMNREDIETVEDIESANNNVGASADPENDEYQRASIDAQYPQLQMTTGYGINEPQWTIGNDIPPLIYSRSPYQRVLLPSMYEIHPVLAFGQQGLDWTIDQAPNTAVLALGCTGVDPNHWISAAATDPPTSTPITINIEKLAFSITVYPVGTVVTVRDVLMAVYVGARRCVTERMPAHVVHEVGVVDDFRSLVKVVPRTRTNRMDDDEICSDVRRSTGYSTIWVGLAPSLKEDDVWCLHTRCLDDNGDHRQGPNSSQNRHVTNISNSVGVMGIL